MPKSTIRYVRRNATPKEKHYTKSKYPLGSTQMTSPKYHTVVKVKGKVWNQQKGKWQNEERIVTVSHNSLAQRHEIEEYAEQVVKKKSQEFQITGSFLIGGRKTPVEK